MVPKLHALVKGLSFLFPLSIIDTAIMKLNAFIIISRDIKVLGLLYTMEQIINVFKTRVVGKKVSHQNHDCSGGHWLEREMGLKLNSLNEPDLNGFEMKKYNKKITFGDWCANEYIFGGKNKIKRDDFLKYFGSYKEDKKRYSWSGSCFPKYGIWNYNGQRLIFNEDEDLVIEYSSDKDTREIQKDYDGYMILAKWKRDKLMKCVNSKFGEKGFFICKKNNGVYDEILFGNPINYEYFKEKLKEGDIYIDSGMYQGNNRKYSVFRADFGVWEELIHTRINFDY